MAQGSKSACVHHTEALFRVRLGSKWWTRPSFCANRIIDCFVASGSSNKSWILIIFFKTTTNKNLFYIRLIAPDSSALMETADNNQSGCGGRIHLAENNNAAVHGARPRYQPLIRQEWAHDRAATQKQIGINACSIKPERATFPSASSRPPPHCLPPASVSPPTHTHSLKSQTKTLNCARNRAK